MPKRWVMLAGDAGLQGLRQHRNGAISYLLVQNELIKTLSLVPLHVHRDTLPQPCSSTQEQHQILLHFQGERRQ